MLCSKKNQHGYPLPDHEPMPTKIDFLNSSIDTWLVRQTKWEMHIEQHTQPAMPSSSVKSTILFARCSMSSFWRHFQACQWHRTLQHVTPMRSKQNHHGYRVADHELMPPNLAGLPII
jgi:hypothetical protein